MKQKTFYYLPFGEMSFHKEKFMIVKIMNKQKPIMVVLRGCETGRYINGLLRFVKSSYHKKNEKKGYQKLSYVILKRLAQKGDLKAKKEIVLRIKNKHN